LSMTVRTVDNLIIQTILPAVHEKGWIEGQESWVTS
jgi:hypothetical protein